MLSGSLSKNYFLFKWDSSRVCVYVLETYLTHFITVILCKISACFPLPVPRIMVRFRIMVIFKIRINVMVRIRVKNTVEMYRQKYFLHQTGTYTTEQWHCP